MRRHGKATQLRDQIIRSESRKLIARMIIDSTELIAADIDVHLIKFEPIDCIALGASQRWVDTRYGWERVPQWKASDAKGFDLSLWYGEDLC